MRQEPDIPREKLTACLRAHYALDVVSARFLPIGNDLKAFVYEAITAQGHSYFIKIRAGEINPSSLLVPRVLIEKNVPNILAPLRTTTQGLWCLLDGYSVIVYPFIRGENAKVAGMTDSQWLEFGATLKAIHAGGFASLLRGQVPTETFSIPSAQLVRRLSDRIHGARFDSAAAAHLASLWIEYGSLIEHLLVRAEDLGKQLQSRSFEYVLCHGDIHAANVLISEEGRIYLVDWDGPLLAPRERDLLFIVGSTIGRRVEPREEALFFQSYGAVDVDWTALAYYRYERAIEDIGEVGQRVIWDTDLSEEAKEHQAKLFAGQFHGGKILEAAMEADRRQGGPPSLLFNR